MALNESACFCFEHSSAKNTPHSATSRSNQKDSAFAGSRSTDDFQDYTKNNFDMIHSQFLLQCIDAVRFHDKVTRENPNSDITITGHSLGGSNAEITSAIRGILAVTFNAYGVRDIFASYTRIEGYVRKCGAKHNT